MMSELISDAVNCFLFWAVPVAVKPRCCESNGHMVQVTAPTVTPYNNTPSLGTNKCICPGTQKTRLCLPASRALAGRLGANPLARNFNCRTLCLVITVFLTPFAIVFKISFSEVVIASPPIKDVFDWTGGWLPTINTTLENYEYLVDDDLYIKSYGNSLRLAAIATIACLLIGFPMAYAIARAQKTTRNILLLLVILPFWTSFLLRVYAWIGIINRQGVLNNILIWLGVIDEPLRLMYTEFAVFLGITYSYLPFMILPLYANLE